MNSIPNRFLVNCLFKQIYVIEFLSHIDTLGLFVLMFGFGMLVYLLDFSEVVES